MSSTQHPYDGNPIAQHILSKRYWQSMRSNRLDRSATRRDIDAARAAREAVAVPSPGLSEDELDFTMGVGGAK